MNFETQLKDFPENEAEENISEFFEEIAMTMSLRDSKSMPLISEMIDFK
jgi:hypothetical protein